MTLRECSCGSGAFPEPISDARGIFVTYVCDKCRADKLKGYRQEIFTNPNYECDEDIDPEHPDDGWGLA